MVESVPVSERAAGLQKVDLNKNDLPMERTLGIQWCIGSDDFTFQVHVKEQSDTRRGVLAIVASIYDPMGFISSFVLKGKAILQEMCKRSMLWDDPVPEGLMPRWQK